MAATVLVAIMAVFPTVLTAGGEKQADEKIVGTWVLVSAEEGGKNYADDSFHLIFTADGKFSLKRKEPNPEFSGVYKLNPNKKPKEIDLMTQEGVPKKETGLGIYTIEGDTLKICLGEFNKARPTEFMSPKGSRTAIMVLQRQKK